MFRRRVELHPIQRLRELLWPRAGWKRTIQYGWRRVWRLSGTPHAIALGTAAGAFASCTPFVGFHFIIGFVIAWIVRGNLIASAFGTFLGNPLTFPVIWLTTYDLGVWMVGRGSVSGPPADLSPSFFMDQGREVILPIVKPMAAGSVPIGLIVGVACYVSVRGAVEAYQARRREHIAARAKVRPDGRETGDQGFTG